jgi:hypothetical protein
MRGHLLFMCARHVVIAMGCKSRMSVAVRIISQEQGCPLRGGIRRKLEANIRAYEQKLHTGGSTRVMLHKKQKPQHCTDCTHVNVEAT